MSLTFSSIAEPESNDALLYYTEKESVPDISASSWLVFDADTGEQLFFHNEEEVRPIASITKLATAVAFLEGNDLTATTTITWSDLNAEGIAGKLSVGEEYTYHELLFPLLLESSNDAAEVLRRVDANILNKMDEVVQDIGLTKTAFADTSGLSDQNVSTASEISQLLRHVSVAHPHLIDITKLPSYINSKNGWMNNDPVIKEEGFAGGKHGFTYSANRTFAGLFKEELFGRHVRTFGYVLLGSDDLVTDVRALRAFAVANTRVR